MLVAARFEDGEPMDDGETSDQLITLLLAGSRDDRHGPRMDRRPAACADPGPMTRLRAEIEDGAGDEYLRAVIAEGLRLAAGGADRRPAPGRLPR